MDGRDIMDLLDGVDYLDGVGGCIRLLTQLGSCWGNTPLRGAASAFFRPLWGGFVGGGLFVRG